MNISDVKVNSTIEFDGKLWYVVEYQKVSRPRLAALFRTKLKNIETGQVLEKNFLPSETVGEVFVLDAEDLVHGGDDSLFCAARREILEETGIKLKDTDTLKRMFRFKFTFKDKQYNRGQKYYLVAYDDKNNIEVLRHEILIDIAFANDFGFDI